MGFYINTLTMVLNRGRWCVCVCVRVCVCMCEEGTILLEIPPKVHKEMGLASVIHGYCDRKIS